MSQLISETEFFAGRKRALEGAETSSVVVTAVDLGQGRFGVLSRYPDAEWKLPHTLFPASTPEAKRKLKFQSIPACFQPQMRQMMLHYMAEGIEGRGRAVGKTLVAFFKNAKAFLTYLESRFNIMSLQAVSPLHCVQYGDYQKARISQQTKKPLGEYHLTSLFLSVETLHLLSQHTNDQLVNPWPDNSAANLAGKTCSLGSGREGKTKIIPDHILAPLFASCVDAIKDADRLLGLRAGVEALRSEKDFSRKNNGYLSAQGWVGGLEKLDAEIDLLFTGCMIVVFTTTGIRVHELAHIGAGRYHKRTNKTGGYYSTLGDDGERYYWIRTRSDKTKAGVSEFLATELTQDALKVAERISAPLREQLGKDIALLQAERPNDPRLVEKQQHTHAVFLGKTLHKGNDITTLSDATINNRLSRI
jgi:hypothetical protein